MRLANHQPHPSVVGFPTYTMPMPMHYMPYGYAHMEPHDPIHLVPPPEYPHLVPVEALTHTDLHALSQQGGVPHLVDGQVAMLPMTHMPHVEKGQHFPHATPPIPVAAHPSMPLIPGHLPTHQLPEWFHEEKDNSLNLQEKMGLV